MAVEELNDIRKRYIIAMIVYCPLCVELTPDAYIAPTISIDAAQRPFPIIMVGRRPLFIANLRLVTREKGVFDIYQSLREERYHLSA